ncbi:unnamed protein product [Zymoseptoria tritici ST99CH_1A5]|uniref:Uncharacterized protein n=1 Tax=Zymoseptoria tritici ST99CH_1A5 TaxID=1276529 RepID=A0A1Y6LZP7_ZYMTR|nr:unnamed protein product [Zymoseptoria tritici ST99CH_1A5]
MLEQWERYDHAFGHEPATASSNSDDGQLLRNPGPKVSFHEDDHERMGAIDHEDESISLPPAASSNARAFSSTIEGEGARLRRMACELSTYFITMAPWLLRASWSRTSSNIDGDSPWLNSSYNGS